MGLGHRKSRSRKGLFRRSRIWSLQPSRGGDGSKGFILNGIDAGDDSGISVSAARDVNGDGIDDILIGAFLASPGGRTYAGESYVVFGRPALVR